MPKNKELEEIKQIILSEGTYWNKDWIVQPEELAQALIDAGYGKAEDFELDRDKFISICSDLADDHFPKGECKERGKLLVFIGMLSIAFSTTSNLIRRKK